MKRFIRMGRVSLLLMAVVSLLAGCASQRGSFIHPAVDFSYIRRCAILPFQNLTSDDFADERMRSIFMTEVLAEGALEIVGPGETLEVMETQALTPGLELTPAEIVELGRALKVDGFFFGVIEEYGMSRSDRSRGHVVTAVFGLIETQTGTTIWRAQVHASGTSIWTKLFGGGTASLFEVSRQAVRRALETLF